MIFFFQTDIPHHLPGRANAHSAWALGPATSELLRKAQYARPLLGWHAQWSHSHILAGVLSCPWMSTMARRRARGAEDGTCTAPLHHVAAVRRRTLAMSTASARWGAARQLGRTSPRGGPPVRGAVISCAVAQCALMP